MGQVHVHGEYWRALSPTHIARGQHVWVAGRDGLTLFVDTKGKANGQPTTSVAAVKSNPNREGAKS